MKFGLRLMAFWIFSLLVGGGYAGIGELDAMRDVTHTTVVLR